MRPSDFFSAVRDAALALVYPRGCEICGESVESLKEGAACQSCWAKTRIFTGREIICQKCGRLLAGGFNFVQNSLCHQCDEAVFDAARAVGVYEKALRTAVLELKEKPFIASGLRHLLSQTLNRFPLSQTTKIIPVPLHERRLRERGFNQAAIIAQAVSRDSGLRMLENCLIRESYTKQHRGAMDERARRESVEKSFAVKQPHLIKNEQIILIDDVFTSGATASACAAALKESGANAVFVLTVARAV